MPARNEPSSEFDRASGEKIPVQFQDRVASATADAASIHDLIALSDIARLNGDQDAVDALAAKLADIGYSA